MTIWRRYFAAPTSGDGTPLFYGDLSEWNDTEDLVRLKARTTPYVTATNGHDLAQGDEAIVGRRVILVRSYVLPDVLPARTLTGRFRFVALVGGNNFGTSAPAYVQAVVKVLTPTGETRGLLAASINTSAVTTTSYSTRRIDTALTPVTAQAGDRLVVEVGADAGLNSGTNSGFIMRLGGDVPAASADLPFADGITAPGMPWFELELTDPPPAVTGLEVLELGSDSFTVGWDPTTGATGYHVYVDGVFAADVPSTGPLEHTALGLDPATGYTVDVYAYNGAGTGEPATLVVSTLNLPAGYYRAVVELGDQSWSATRLDSPQLGVTLPLTLGWSMAEDASGYPAQLDPATATVQLVLASGEQLAGVDVGTTMRVRVWLDPAPAARPYATFAGRVADLEVSPHALGVAVRLLGVDYTLDLAARSVGGQAEWPAETGDARAGRIMAENGDEPWTAETIGNTFEPRTAQPASALEALRETLTAAARFTNDDWSAPGRVLLTPDVDAAGRLTRFRGVFRGAESTAIDKVPAAVWRSTSWLRNRVTDGRWVHIDHPGGPTVYGERRGTPRPRVAVPVHETDALAQLVLGVTPRYSWLSGAPLRLDLSHPDATAPLDWFWRDPDSPAVPAVGRVVVVDVCDALPGMFTRYAGMLAAAQLTLDPGGRPYVDFRLRPDVPAHSSVTPRWEDEPIDQTWSDEPPAATWYELRTIHREDYLT